MIAVLQVKPLLRLLAQTAITFVVLLSTTYFPLRQSRAHGDDLVQDYVSARAWIAGESPYQTLNQLREQAGFPPVPDHVRVRFNPHPPGAILLTAGLARMDFATALWWGRGLQLLALALTWAIAYRLFDPPTSPWLWALIGGLFGVWAPLWQGLDWGQPVGVLALVVIAAWGLARKERPGWFGLVLGFACTVRPFVAILAVLACGWSWRKLRIALAATLVGGLVPFLLTGIWPWEWYRLASDAKGYVEECGSLPGVLGIGNAGGVVLFALAVCVLAYLRYRGLNLDFTAALAAVCAMLTYPLAWFQYDVSLVPVVAWVAAQATRSGNRLALLSLLAFLLLRTMPDIIPDPQGTGLVDVIGRNKGWVQVTARGLLLLSVSAVTWRRSAASVYAPS